MKKVAVDHFKLAYKFPTGYYYIYERYVDIFNVKDPEFVTLVSSEVTFAKATVQYARNIGAHEICSFGYKGAEYIREEGWQGRLILTAQPHEDPVLIAAHDVEFTGVSLERWNRRIIAEYAQLGFDIHITNVPSITDVINLSKLPIRSISTILPLKAAAAGVILHPDPDIAANQDWFDDTPVEWCEYFPGIAHKNLETVKAWLNGKQGEVPVWL